ncbi:MAG: NAD(P)-dependent oxidoreductase [Mycobacteriaceae bacterium]|nr:NAD(P)-dependent oxidoreductase [Mycobacteriaceae bacterium]
MAQRTNKKTVFVTGTTGSMGGAALRELMSRRDRFDIVTLARPSAKNRMLLEPYLGQPGVRVDWGDLTNYDDVERCVRGADYVLHAAALISPEADRKPAQAWKVNVGSAENIVRAVKAQPEPDAVKLVTVGTVAATGDRLAPIHWGRCGDPLKPSVYDMYACSKIAAERIVAESGLRHWAIVRQTFIAIPDMTTLIDPIMFHQPIDTCIEFCTVADSGRLLANACEDFVSDEFWRGFYNIGGGQTCRVTYHEFMQRAFDTLGFGEVAKVTERNWFATRNFHCQWYEDSDDLESHLRFRSEGLDDLLEQVARTMPRWQRLGARVAPQRLMKKVLFERLASATPDAPMHWIKHRNDMRVSAFFASYEDWASIPAWDSARPRDLRGLPRVRLDHGYDETKAVLGLDDMRAAAAFRGGECTSGAMDAGDAFAPLGWRCAFGHAFSASPNLVLKGGHWCPECAPPGWNFDQEAKKNPFLAQVWYPNHDQDESNVYPEDCHRDVAVG